MTGELESVKGDTQDQKVIPTGAGCAGRIETESPIIQEKECPRHRTVKGRKRRKGHRHKKNPGGTAGNGKRGGQHVPRGIYEATAILVQEGYTVGRVLDPDCPFDLIGWSYAGSILVRVVRPKETVANARNVREQYEAVIREMEPYYRSVADNLQFLVISRENGLLRYRVFNWGIGNVGIMQKIMKTSRELPADKQTVAPEHVNRRARNSPCPDMQTGVAGAPDITPVRTAIPS